METRRQCETMAEIGMNLIECDPDLEYIKLASPTVVFLVSDKAKKSGTGFVKGECEKVPDKWKWAVPADYAITIYERNCEGMSDYQMAILMKHELMHIKIDAAGFGIRKHDLEDFRTIVKEFGANWDYVPDKEPEDINMKVDNAISEVDEEDAEYAE